MTIKTVAHKGLELYILTGDVSGINPEHADRIRKRVTVLENMTSLMDLRGRWRFHALKGDRKGQYAINVSGNYRLFFEYEDGHVYLLDYGDYH